MTVQRIMFDLNDLARECHTVAASKGWVWDPVNFGEILALVHSELSEALEEYRDGKLFDEVYKGPNGKPEGIPIELADAIIRILHFCDCFSIDINNAVIQKLEYNKTRPHRHGNKVV